MGVPIFIIAYEYLYIAFVLHVNKCGRDKE